MSKLFGDPDPLIEVEYKYTGIYGEMEVENELLGINRREITETITANAYLDFGDLIYVNHHCRSFIQTLQAMRNFHQRTMQSLPYDHLKVITSEIGIPFATVNKIRVPSYFNYTFSTAKHEITSTARYSKTVGLSCTKIIMNYCTFVRVRLSQIPLEVIHLCIHQIGTGKKHVLLLLCRAPHP